MNFFPFLKISHNKLFQYWELLNFVIFMNINYYFRLLSTVTFLFSPAGAKLLVENCVKNKKF